MSFQPFISVFGGPPFGLAADDPLIPAMWRALRLGDVQLADAAHLAEDQPAGRALDQLSSALRPIERGTAERARLASVSR